MTKMFANKKMKERRTELGISQTELADLLRAGGDVRVSYSLVQKWEQGIKPLTPTAALEVARMLKISVDQIIERKEV